ncbi:DUF1266 domain-containing protein [Gordonia polyisoprenivorans]|uniref:DUF1266 domain-containing protein n=1 Tax=Gordonia polyisoprenivorans TaxID=84595 RepID=UPI001AD6CA8A|nr:DUF1266 domain-containing protein [Gordonia polyisoprenivorans]QTI70313.1 DUF1266 domain-containing protein [Gordonia polyisoprenivorans]
MTTLSVGDDLAGYRIVRRLGPGALGERYLADHPRLPRRDVLTVPHPGADDDADARARFTRAVDIASSLLHPHIVPVHDRGDSDSGGGGDNGSDGDGVSWVSTAYVDGSDVGALLAESGTPLSPDAVADIVAAVSDALDHAHAHGLAHTDLRAGEILLDAQRHPYLTGFVFAGPAEVADDQAQLARTAIDMLGSTVGLQVDHVTSRACSADLAQRYPSCRDFAAALRAALGGVEDGVASSPTVVTATASPTVVPAPPTIAAPPMPVTGGPIRWSGYPGTVEQLRGLACGAFFAVSTSQDPVDHLTMAESDRSIRKIIRRAWAITDTASAIDTTELLALGLVTADYDAVLAGLTHMQPGAPRSAIRLDPAAADAIAAASGVDAARARTVAQAIALSRTLPQQVPVSTAAWELGQAVELVRMCHRAGLVEEIWAWAAIIDLGRRAQQRYADWTAFVLGFEWGRALASAEDARDPAAAADESCARTRPVLSLLLTDPTSPWTRIPLQQ